MPHRALPGIVLTNIYVNDDLSAFAESF